MSDAPKDDDDLVVMTKTTYAMLQKVVYDAHLELAALRAAARGPAAVTLQPTVTATNVVYGESTPLPLTEALKAAPPAPRPGAPRTAAALDRCPYCEAGRPATLEPHPDAAKRGRGVVRQVFTCGHRRNIWPAT
jgi:hypothetical protein